MKNTIKVKGMTCGGCKMGVENAVRRLPGISYAEASLEKAEVVVEYDEKKTALKDLRAAIEKAGFTAE